MKDDLALDLVKKKRILFRDELHAMKRLAIEIFTQEMGGQKRAAESLSDYHDYTISQSMLSRAIKYGRSVEKLYPLISAPMYEVKRNQWPPRYIADVVKMSGFAPRYYQIVRAGRKFGVITGITSLNGKRYITVSTSLNSSLDLSPKELEFL